MSLSASTNVFPIVFAFDENLEIPAKVTFSSILTNISDTCSIQFIVLFNDKSLGFTARERLKSLVARSEKATTRFIDVGNAFDTAFEIRNITIPTYYRLLLPNLLPEFERALYLDVDTVILRDISPLFHVDLGSSLLAGVKGVYQNRDYIRLESLGIEPGNYINAGVLLLNLAAMRRERLQQQFLELARKEFTFQDQDILNLACHRRIRHLPPAFNVHAMFDYEQEREFADQLFGNDDVDEAITSPAIIHYAGKKPWETAECFHYDRWWEAYRGCRSFDQNYYLAHQRKIVRCYAENRACESLRLSKKNTAMAKRLRSRLRSCASKMKSVLR